MRRTGNFLRSNAVGFLALFVALGGVAWAATAPRNSVVSKSIRDGQVKSVDVAADAIDGSKVADGALDGQDLNLAEVVPGGDLINALDDVDIGPGTVGPAELASEAVTPADFGSIPAVRADGPNGTDGTCTGPPSIPGNGDLTRIGFSGEEFDTANLHNASCLGGDPVTRLTAPIDGLYQVSAGVVWTTNPTGTRFLGIRKNGSDDLYQVASRIPASADVPEQSVSTLVSLDAGDYLEVVLSQNSGSAAAIDFGFERNHFAMHWVGPS
jgi:hypothetical protein